MTAQCSVFKQGNHNQHHPIFPRLRAREEGEWEERVGWNTGRRAVQHCLLDFWPHNNWGYLPSQDSVVPTPPQHPSMDGNRFVNPIPSEAAFGGGEVIFLQGQSHWQIAHYPLNHPTPMHIQTTLIKLSRVFVVVVVLRHEHRRGICWEERF